MTFVDSPGSTLISKIICAASLAREKAALADRDGNPELARLHREMAEAREATARAMLENHQQRMLSDPNDTEGSYSSFLVGSKEFRKFNPGTATLQKFRM